MGESVLAQDVWIICHCSVCQPTNGMGKGLQMFAGWLLIVMKVCVKLHTSFWMVLYGTGLQPARMHLGCDCKPVYMQLQHIRIWKRLCTKANAILEVNQLTTELHNYLIKHETEIILKTILRRRKWHPSRRMVANVSEPQPIPIHLGCDCSACSIVKATHRHPPLWMVSECMHMQFTIYLF